MATVVRRSRLVPDSVVALAAVAGLLIGLAALCCCLGEHGVTHGTGVTHGIGRVAAAGLVVASDTDSDVVMAGDPPDQDAGDTGDGCRHPGDRSDAVVTSSGAITRDLPAAVPADIRRPDLDAARPAVVVDGVAARAPASHLLCIMRT